MPILRNTLVGFFVFKQYIHGTFNGGVSTKSLILINR